MRPTRPAPPLLALLAALLPLLAGACAARPPADDPDAVAEFRQNNDPIEPFNPGSYAVHQAIDKYALAPVARATAPPSPPPCAPASAMSWRTSAAR